MSQTSLKQKKNEPRMRSSKESLEAEKRKESDKTGVRLNNQGSQESSLRKTDSRGYLVRSQWSRTSRSPSTKAPSIDEPRSRNTSAKLPSSSTSSRTPSTSPSLHDSSPLPLSGQPSLQPPASPQLPRSLDSRPPTPPEPDPGSRRSTKMQENPEACAQGIVREIRQTRDSQPLEYSRTSSSQRRGIYPASTQLDRNSLSEQQQQREDEDYYEAACWASMRSFYEKNPSCSRPWPPKPKNAITIALSSCALFNMVDGRKIYEEEGLEKYMEYQLTNENVILTPGPAFRFVKALQYVNARLRDLYPDEQDLFDIVLMTNNHAQVGVRLINSVNHYGLLIDRFCLTGGKNPIGYLKAYLTNLYIAADSEKVQEAIQEGIASATMFDGAKDMAYCDTQLRVAFDGDAVLFSDESEHFTKEHGLDKFFQYDTLCESKPLAQGPLKGFLEDLGRLQKKFYAKNERLLCPIRTYLVTARSAASSGARVLKTLRRWGLEIDEALFLAGAPKSPILVKIRPHIFFDDHMFHIEGAQRLGSIAAHGFNKKFSS
ncbi:cytosolic 5'-nucleotidase 1B isoform X4 [Pan paniscus]|uniref:cytosolic 5'-nucleotidase 1B isoform X4 n=1 Tax=Pan paniscus TaxID=9597 RepID=UPI0024363477|nr:cytosolic 5'-nucleotidase 1B isoform X4 [Pan paniscus]